MQTVKNGLAWVGFIALAVIAIMIARDKMAVSGLELTNAIVKPQTQPVMIVVTPTLAPAAPVYVPEAPTAVPTAVPVMAPDNATVPMVSIAVGTVTEADAQFLAACAAGQAAGRRVSPNCPPRSGQPLTVVGPTLTYCYQGDGWTPERMATVADGFAAWAATGITFTEDAANCQTAVVLTTDDTNHAGHGGMGMIDFNLTYGLLPQAAIHEVGHILGLLDSNAGAMAGTYMLGAPATYPTADEVAAVRQIWGIK